MSEEKQALRGGVVSRTILSTMGLGIQGLTRFAYTVFIGRFIGEAALADASALLSISVWMALAMPSGLGTAASRYFPLESTAGAAATQLRRWFWISSTVLSLATIPIAYWLVDDLVAALCCAALVFTYNGYTYTRGAMMGEDRIVLAAVADFVSSIIAVTALVLVLLGGAHWAMLLPLAVGFGVFSIISRPRTPRGPVSVQDRRLFGRFLRDAIVGGLAVGGLLPATMIFVRAFDTPVQAGLFAAALSLATPANMVAQAAGQVLLPHFTRFSGDPLAMLRSQRRLFWATTAVFAVLFLALIVLAPFILTLLFGERYADGTLEMQLLLGIVFLISASTSPASYLFAAGRQRVYATVWLISLIVGIITMFITCPLFGMWGAMLGYALGGGGGSLAIMWCGYFLTNGSRPVPTPPDAEE